VREVAMELENMKTEVRAYLLGRGVRVQDWVHREFTFGNQTQNSYVLEIDEIMRKIFNIPASARYVRVHARWVVSDGAQYSYSVTVEEARVEFCNNQFRGLKGQYLLQFGKDAPLSDLIERLPTLFKEKPQTGESEDSKTLLLRVIDILHHVVDRLPP
jgi:hypothetical protein